MKTVTYKYFVGQSTKLETSMKIFFQQILKLEGNHYNYELFLENQYVLSAVCTFILRSKCQNIHTKNCIVIFSL